MHANPAYLEAALNAGATGYVLKSAAHEEIFDAIQSVLKGLIYVTPGLSSQHLERFGDPSHAAVTFRLSTREREVLQLIAEGKSTKECAVTLDISVKTAETYRSRIMEKLDIHETASMVRYAIRRGLVQP